jgi:hypothetical protein
MKPLGDPWEIFTRSMQLTMDGKYTVDKENTTQLRNLVGYFTLGKTELHPRKGVTLIGNPGAGKTSVMECLSLLVRNTPLKFRVVPCLQAVLEFSTQGEQLLINLVKQSTMFDDMMNEPMGKYFAKEREIMPDLIFSSWNTWKRGQQVFHFTTNYGKADIIRRYGEHSWSRLNQMTNMVKLGALETSRDRREDTVPIPFDSQNFPKFFITPEEEQIAIADAKIREAYKNPEIRQPSKPMSLGERMRQQIYGIKPD